jgi:hypothetical protein
MQLDLGIVHRNRDRIPVRLPIIVYTSEKYLHAVNYSFENHIFQDILKYQYNKNRYLVKTTSLQYTCEQFEVTLQFKQHPLIYHKTVYVPAIWH